MEKIIAECKTIWTEEQNQHTIRIIQNGLSGKKLSGGDYHIIKKFEVVSMGGVYRIEINNLAVICLLNIKLH